jgi:type II secretory ATPase GspE/PulE/Tfp pilus assembly ATPase PilB-like protein
MESGVTEIIERILREAEEANASDIHIDAYDATVIVRFRIDGQLSIHCRLPKDIHGSVISRLKIMSRLRTDLHHLPQDGRFRKPYRGNHDTRISILPTPHGEAVVLRLLKDTPDFRNLENLGLSSANAAILERAVSRKRGMVLATGSTGSGKTTTLYSLLRLVEPERLVITIEDPVEYSLPNARQIQIDPDRGLTFATGLRSILRQDPDVIMVGEIRDQETASIAIHAALTGHLLFSTLHTSSALAVIFRLMDMGIAPYLVASTLETIIAQRLVRKICQQCHSRRQKKRIQRMCDVILDDNSIDGEENENLGTGCQACNYTGHNGRVALYEIVTMNEELREAVAARPTLAALRTIADRAGMQTLIADGHAKAERGLIDAAEVMSSE